MTRQRFSRFNSLMLRIASSRPGALLLSRSLHPFDRIFLKLTRGRMTMTSLLSGLPIVILTTTGAKSGLPRTVPVLCIRDECLPDALTVVASNRGQRHHPAWYFNLKANPRVTCVLGGQVGEYVAREACGEEYERLWQCAANTYIGYPLYKLRAGDRHIPIMVLTPVEPAAVAQEHRGAGVIEYTLPASRLPLHAENPPAVDAQL